MLDKELFRSFVAIDFPEIVIGEIARIQDILKNLRFTGKMTELENVHLTLKFLGEITKNKLREVKNKLSNIKMNSFKAKLEKVGIFHFKGKPRIVWIKLTGKGIFELQEYIDKTLEEIGFKREARFMGHITIARLKYVKDKKAFKEYIDNIALKNIKFTINKFKLKTSELRDIGPIYQDIGIYQLT